MAVRKLTLGSLFNGIGGWIIAGNKYGVKTLWESEVEKYCEALMRVRFPDVQQLGDVTKIDGAKIQPVDIICSGSPCQSFSVAGKRNGMDGQSGLFRDFVRIVKQMKEATNGKYPKWVIWENVPGAFTSTDGKDIIEVLESFDKLGYVLDMNVLDAQYMGVPQRRRRIFATWLNVETLRKMRTNLSFSIITQCLVELLVCILVVKLNPFTNVQTNLVLNQKNLSEDGLLKKMKLFGIVERQQFWNLLQDWTVTLQNYMTEPERLDVLLGLTDEPIQEGTKESELKHKLEKEPFGNTDMLWSSLLDDLYKKEKSFTTLTETSEITEKTICTCAKILENINWFMCHLTKLWKYWSQTEQYVLTMRKACIDYVETRSTSGTLFESMEWLQYWDDYICALSEKRFLSIADITKSAGCSQEILSFSQSLSGDSEQGRKTRKRVASTIEKSIRTASEIVHRGGTSVVKIRSGRDDGTAGKGALIGLEQSFTLGTGNDQTLFQDVSTVGGQIYDMTHAQDVIRESEKVPTLNARMGTGGNQVPILTVNIPEVVVMGHDERSAKFNTEVTDPLTACDYKQPQIVAQMSTTGGAERIRNRERTDEPTDDDRQDRSVELYARPNSRHAETCGGKQTIGSLCAHDGRGFNGQDVEQGKLIVEIGDDSI